MVKIKDVLDGPPKQLSSYVMNMPQSPLRNTEEYLKAYIGYIYTATGAIAQEVASIELHLYKAKYTKNGVETKEVYEHPALSVLNYANSISTLYDMIEATQTYLDLTGEAFWVALRDNNGMPRELWALRPDWVKIMPSATEVIDHYNYYAGGILSEKVEIPKENVIPFRYFNPLNPYRGKGPTQAAALPFDILNFAGEYNRNFFFNSAIPSMVFSTDQKISESSVKRFLNQWQGSFGGRAKSNKVAFLGQGLKMDKASFAAKELDFIEQMKQMRDDVLAVFKVPKTVLGLTDDVNRANADATTRAFMERVITPRMTKFVASLNEFYLPMFETDGSLFFDFYDPAPEDVEIKLKKYESGRKYGWLTANEIRIEENLDPLPGGDDLAPASGGLTLPIKPDTTNPDATKPNDDANEDVDDEPNKPTADDTEGKGLKGLVMKLFNLKEINNKTYAPPAYLLKRIEAKKHKHMIRLPVKRLEKLEEEELVVKFVPELKKFISQLITNTDHSSIKTKAGKDAKFTEILDKAMKEQEALNKKKIEEKEAKKERVKKAITKGAGWSEEQKISYWNDFIKATDDQEIKIKANCQSVFNKQEAVVLANLNEQMRAWRKILGIKATARTIVPSIEELDLMWKTLEKLLKEIYIEQGNATLDFLGIDGEIDITTEFASQYLNEYGGLLITGIDTTTRDALMASLSEGFDKGEGIPELSKRVRDIFDIADKSRSEAIARSEALRASNSATVEAYRQSGVVIAKEWLTEMDGSACPFCEELDGKVVELNVNYFDKGDSLTVGDQTMKFDYTDIGEPPAHTNCRCTTIPVLESEKSQKEKSSK